MSGIPHDSVAETVMTNGLIWVVHLHALGVPGGHGRDKEYGIWNMEKKTEGETEGETERRGGG